MSDCVMDSFEEPSQDFITRRDPDLLSELPRSTLGPSYHITDDLLDANSGCPGLMVDIFDTSQTSDIGRSVSPITPNSGTIIFEELPKMPPGGLSPSGSPPMPLFGPSPLDLDCYSDPPCLSFKEIDELFEDLEGSGNSPSEMIDAGDDIALGIGAAQPPRLPPGDLQPRGSSFASPNGKVEPVTIDLTMSDDEPGEDLKIYQPAKQKKRRRIPAGCISTKRRHTEAMFKHERKGLLRLWSIEIRRKEELKSEIYHFDRRSKRGKWKNDDGAVLEHPVDEAMCIAVLDKNRVQFRLDYNKALRQLECYDEVVGQQLCLSKGEAEKGISHPKEAVQGTWNHVEVTHQAYYFSSVAC